MPVPLIAVVVVAGALAAGGVGLVLAIRQLVRFMANKKLAILGAQGVGKTTLFQTLRDGKPPKGSKAIVDPEPGLAFSLRMGRKDVRFEIPKDLPGHAGVALPGWKAAFETSDYVWYLFRADLIAAEDVVATEAVKTHLDLFKSWLTAMKGIHPKILLVGTFADSAPDHLQTAVQLKQAVANSEPIKAAVVKLGHAGLVVGSLATAPKAGALIRAIRDEVG